MSFINVEIKARCSNPDFIRDYLKEQHASFKGTDHQIDTYFNVPKGRLKLREGKIENNLIYYQREDKQGPKKCEYHLYPTTMNSPIKALLTDALGIRIVVDKQREIYFIENVKFHIDNVDGLGSFVEIEAIDQWGTIGEGRLEQQCQDYLAQLQISSDDLLTVSYADLMEARENTTAG